MKATKREKLEAAGWTVAGATELLGLNPAEESFVEVKLALSRSLRSWRAKRRLTQGELATMLRSSQSRVAKMEAGDPTVSIDLLMRSLLQLGARRQDIAKAIG